MHHYLALDIGLRRTGVAYASSDAGVPLALKTIKHDTFDVLNEKVADLFKEKDITHLIVGLPLLPSGDEGEQVEIVRSAVDKMPIPSHILTIFIDERHTTPREKYKDPDAAAACEILSMYLHKENI